MKNIKESNNIITNEEKESSSLKQLKEDHQKIINDREQERKKEIENINYKLRSIRNFKIIWYKYIGSITFFSIIVYIFFNNWKDGEVKFIFDIISTNVFFVAIGIATIGVSFAEVRTNSLENELSEKCK